MERSTDLVPGSPCPDARPVSSLCFDSRKCTADSAFFAFQSQAGGADGQQFIASAIGLGATVIICRNNEETLALSCEFPSVRFVFCPEPQAVFSRWCSLFWDEPQKKLRIIGITGTDGKTSTCDFLYQLLKNHGHRTALLSTVSMDDGKVFSDSPYRQSTPEADCIYSFLSRCVKNHVGVVVLEATSHALSHLTSRLRDIVFDGAVFTTISSEHLEFHGTLAGYVDSKLNLARQTRSDGFLVYPQDSEYAGPICHAFSGEQKSAYRTPEVTMENLAGLVFSFSGRSFRFCYGEAIFLKNAMAALQAARFASGEDIPVSDLENLVPVKGRMKVIHSDSGDFVIDFAHTADSFQRLFSFIKTVCPGKKLTVLFSCGGHRDTVKRPKMGVLAAGYCQTIILSDEDPRDEGFEKITADILSEADTSRNRLFLIPDRKTAIRKAVQLSDRQTVTLLLGKGHEKTIELGGGVKIPWDEEQTLKEALDGK